MAFRERIIASRQKIRKDNSCMGSIGIQKEKQFRLQLCSAVGINNKDCTGLLSVKVSQVYCAEALFIFQGFVIAFKVIYCLEDL